MALRGSANPDKLLLLKCGTEMIYHFNEVSGIVGGRGYTSNMAFAQNKAKG